MQDPLGCFNIIQCSLQKWSAGRAHYNCSELYSHQTLSTWPYSSHSSLSSFNVAAKMLTTQKHSVTGSEPYCRRSSGNKLKAFYVACIMLRSLWSNQHRKPGALLIVARFSSQMRAMFIWGRIFRLLMASLPESLSYRSFTNGAELSFPPSYSYSGPLSI